MKFTKENLYEGLTFIEDNIKWMLRKNTGHESLGEWEIFCKTKKGSRLARHSTKDLIDGLNNHWNIKIIENYEIY